MRAVSLDCEARGLLCLDFRENLRRCRAITFLFCLIRPERYWSGRRIFGISRVAMNGLLRLQGPAREQEYFYRGRHCR